MIFHTGPYLPLHGTNHASVGRAFSQGWSDYHLGDTASGL